MFGLVRPCRHGAEDAGSTIDVWRAHLCGLCLGLRDGHGQLSRVTTNSDAVVLSILTEAQLAGSNGRKTAGACAFRGMRRADVAFADNPGIQLAATASLLLAAATVSDKALDRDGMFALPMAGRPAGRIARKWGDEALASAAAIGLDARPLLAAIAGQDELERSPDGREITEFTRPAEICAGELFAHSAVLTNRPANVAPLRAVGQQFGRIAHLSDAVEDFAADAANRAFNPIIATGMSLAQTRHLLRQSHKALRKSLDEVAFENRPAVQWLLDEEVSRAISAAFRRGDPTLSPTLNSGSPGPYGPPTGWPPPPGPPPRRSHNLLAAMGIGFGLYCTGYACCADHENPFTGERKDAWIKNCDCDCDSCDSCNCCDCGDCGDCCDCGGCDCSC